LNGTHRLLVYADTGNMLGENTGALLQVSREVSLEVNIQKIRYNFVSPPEYRKK